MPSDTGARLMNKIIVQLKVDASTDFDDLIGVEEALLLDLQQVPGVDVDGHDIGQGRFNVFIHLNGSVWEPALSRTIATLERLRLLHGSLVAKFTDATESYDVVHPDAFSGSFEL